MLNVAIRSMRYHAAHAGADLIQGLEFRVSDGEFISLLGRSGAGKTTLLRMIAGFESNFDGEIQIDGVPVHEPGRAVQMVFQDSRLLPWKTVFENVAFATSDPTGGETRGQVMNWLSRVGLLDKEREWPKNLSGGEATKVAIARALVVSPKILLLDEPFGHLDLVTRFEIQNELLRDLQMTCPSTLLVSHNIDDAVFLSDQIHVLATRPMRIARTFTVAVPRPRIRGDARLSQIASEIADYLSKLAVTANNGGDLPRQLQWTDDCRLPHEI